MAFTTRDWARRKLSMMQGNNQTAINHAIEIINIYEPTHPEISELLEAINNLYITLNDLITSVDEHF